MLLRLTSLRAAAALMVFVFHLGVNGMIRQRWVLGLGFTGVAFFFVLSGFVLTWSLPAGMGRSRFWRNRLARIYPATAVSILVACALPVTGVAVTTPGVVAALLLVQGWVPRESIVFGGANLVTWSLSCEAAFYLALPFVVGRLARSTRVVRWASALTYWGAASVVVAALSWRDTFSFTAMAFAGYDPAIRFGEFLLGMVLALELKAGWRMRWTTAAVLVAVSVAAVNVSRVGMLPDVEMTPLFFAVIALAAQRDLDRPSGALTWRPFVYAGEVSFCFYLVHNLVEMNLRVYVGPGAGVAAAALACSAVAAVALHHVVERPLQRLIRGRSSPGLSLATHPMEPGVAAGAVRLAGGVAGGVAGSAVGGVAGSAVGGVAGSAVGGVAGSAVGGVAGSAVRLGEEG